VIPKAYTTNAEISQKRYIHGFQEAGLSTLGKLKEIYTMKLKGDHKMRGAAGLTSNLSGLEQARGIW
jgi:hypothetical protein